MEGSGKTKEELDRGADLRQPSINTEPRTLDEFSIERAQLAAQEIFAKHPDPTSDCFTKDAVDTATRESAPAEDAADTDALGRQLDESFQNAGNVLDTDFSKSKAPPQIESDTDFSKLKTPVLTEDGDVAPAPPSQEPSS